MDASGPAEAALQMIRPKAGSPRSRGDPAPSASFRHTSGKESGNLLPPCARPRLLRMWTWGFP